MLALSVVEPQSSGIGGGGFLLHHDARSGRLTSIDGRETAPAGVVPELFLGPADKPMPFRQAVEGGTSVGVPGSLALAALAHRRAGRLGWQALFGPAIRLAENGFAVTARLHRYIGRAAAMLRQSPEGSALYLQLDGSPKPVGTVIRNPALARLLREVASRGAAHFYTGTPAARLAETVRRAPANPSSMTVADLAAYEAKLREPLCGGYRQWRICGMGPPSAGLTTVLAVLKMLERFDLAAMGPESASAWHLIAEAMRLAYADRDKWIADPDQVSVPAKGLIDPAYLQRRSALISPTTTLADAPPGRPAKAPKVALVPDSEAGGTTHIAVVDATGSVASLTTTVESEFGSGLVVDGYVLNNELTDFNFVPQVDGVPAANRAGPAKRPRSSMAPTIVYDHAGGIRLAIGAAGGSTIPAQVAKALIGVLDWKLAPDEAIALPQIMGYGGEVRIEEGSWLAGRADELRALGQQVRVTGFPLKANAIERVPGGWGGAADPRSEGVVLTLRADEIGAAWASALARAPEPANASQPARAESAPR